MPVLPAPCPETEARKKLVLWARADSTRTQQWIADRLDVKQQSVGQWFTRRSRPDAEKRAEIETLTGGAVPASSWDTPAEARARKLRADRLRSAVPSKPAA